MSDNKENEQQEVLMKLINMSDEQLDSLFQLLEDQPHLSQFVAKRKAFVLVFSTFKRALTWIMSFIGVLWLGFDKIKDILKFIADTIITVIS